jgi:hypothetical protein
MKIELPYEQKKKVFARLYAVMMAGATGLELCAPPYWSERVKEFLQYAGSQLE